MISYSYDRDCAVYGEEPPTFRCRRCGEVEYHRTEDCTEEYCEQCEAFWDAQTLTTVICAEVNK